MTNGSVVPRVTIEALHTDATPGIANPGFRGDPLEHGRDGAGGGPDRHQAADYLGSTTQTITIAANDTRAAMTFESTLFDSNVSGNLTATVAGGADHLPG